MVQTEQTNIAETKIYQSIWKNMLLVVACFLFVALACIMIQDDTYSIRWPGSKLVGWIGLVFFGVGGIVIFVATVYNRIRHIPLLVIYEDRLELYVQSKGKYQVINFADVSRFRLIKFRSAKMITIDYKNGAIKRKYKESSAFRRWLMDFNFMTVGAMEAIPAHNLTMKGEDLFNLLNKHLE